MDMLAFRSETTTSVTTVRLDCVLLTAAVALF
jgi:hypothetical protein